MSKPIFRMSQAGYCPRKLSAIVLGEPGAAPPSWLSMAAEEGNWHEERIKRELRTLGCDVTEEQRELILDYPDFALVGHIDGLIKLTSDFLKSDLFEVHLESGVDLKCSLLLEVKTFSFFEHQRWLKGGFEAFPQYAGQLACYTQALDIATIAYVTKDRSGGSRRLYVIECPVQLDVVKFQTVSHYVAQGELASADFDSSNIECRRCQFRRTLCSSAPTRYEDTEVEQAAADYLEGRAMVKLGNGLADSAKATLVTFAQQENLTRFDVGVYCVSYSHYPRESISIKRLEALMPRETFEEAISTSKIDRVNVVNHRKEVLD